MAEAIRWVADRLLPFTVREMKGTIMRKIFAGLFGFGLLALAGCQSYEEMQAVYVGKLNQWVGAPEATLVANLGAPSSFYDSQGSRYLTYRRSQIETSSTPGNCYPSAFNRWPYNCYGGQTYTSQSFCQETFEIRGGVVRRAYFNGDGCF